MFVAEQATGRRAPGGVVRRAWGGVALVAALLGGLLAAPLPAGAAPAAEGDALYLVTLDGAGVAGYRGVVPDAVRRLQLRHDQDVALATVDAAAPIYRWTTALNGFAVRLTRGEAAALASAPHVASVEKDAVRRLAGSTVPSAHSLGAPTGAARGGAGVVIGVVDSGIWPESPLFSAVPGLGRSPRGFDGECVTGQGWDAGTCNRKLVGARWFVNGFGAENLRSSSSLSARDDQGHGTQMASIAAGNAEVSVRVNDQRLGSYGGQAPQARLAVYKACWAAPDPADDGCSTADLVTAIDRATQDRVDVLNLSVGGPAAYDTVERALLGAAEADVVVVAAAGNGGGRSFAAHPSPWVTTVGGTTSVLRRGRVQLGSGPSVTGAMASERGAAPARVVVGARVAAPDATRHQARVCTPGSLDASRVSGAIVLCDRGAIGRVDKSAAVEQADGVGMVLANVRPGGVEADFHSVPTVHLHRADATALRRWLARHPAGRVSLRPLGTDRAPARVTSWSASGDPTAAVLKPDLVAPAVGVLGAVPAGVRSTRWDFVSGTSAAAAYTSGVAAVLLRRHGWAPDVVRSALATTALPLGDTSALREGSGRIRPGRAAAPGVAYETDTQDYRAWLDGSRPDLNTPSILMSGRQSSARRTITNIGRRATYFSSSATGFTRHEVTVTPAAVRLGPGESATFTVRVARGAGALPLDDGWITWLSARGTRARIPVLITR